MLEALESPEPMRVSWGRLESGSSCCAVLQSQKWFLRGSFHWWFWPKRPNICDCGWDTRFLIPILWHRHGCHGISQISPYFSHFWAQNGFQVPRISRNAMKCPRCQEVPHSESSCPDERHLGPTTGAAAGAHGPPNGSAEGVEETGSSGYFSNSTSSESDTMPGKLEQLFFGLNFFWNVEYLNVFVYPFWKI